MQQHLLFLSGTLYSSVLSMKNFMYLRISSSASGQMSSIRSRINCFTVSNIFLSWVTVAFKIGFETLRILLIFDSTWSLAKPSILSLAPPSTLKDVWGSSLKPLDIFSMKNSDRGWRTLTSFEVLDVFIVLLRGWGHGNLPFSWARLLY